MIVYFASKMALTKIEGLSIAQILNQFALLALLFFMMLTFSSIDGILEKIPRWLKRIIKYIAEITLEIYVVQYVLIDLLRPIGKFPLNWLAITAAILLVSSALHFVCKSITFLVDISIKKIKEKRQ